jgi:hypothetical protein
MAGDDSNLTFARRVYYFLLAQRSQAVAKAIPLDATTHEGTTNNQRASWAEAVILAFGQRTGSIANAIGDREEPFLIVADLLADLAHWCDRNELDLQSAIQYASRHYHTETGATGKQLSRDS